MAHDRDETGGASYLQRVGEENRRYAHALLAENARLREVATGLETERLQLVDKVRMTEDLLADYDAMREAVERLEQDRVRLHEQLARAQQELVRRERDRDALHARLAEIERESRRFSEEYVEVERRNNDLMNLYVASYRLHATVERREIVSTIQEIVANLVGCEEQALFELDRSAGLLRLVASVGVDPELYASVRPGQGAIGRCVASGETYVAARAGARADTEPDLTACIPLRLDGQITGAIALFRMLPQKPQLEDVDHELFDLLATHAATALYCTALHARQALPSAAR